MYRQSYQMPPAPLIDQVGENARELTIRHMKMITRVC